MTSKQYTQSVYLLTIVDQIFKLIALKYKFNKIALLPHFVQLRVCGNSGFSFSLLTSLPMEYTLYIHTACFLLIALYLYFNRPKNDTGYIAHNLIWAGALSNYIDRICYGSIIDMFEVSIAGRSLFICNLADIYLSLGVIFAFISSFTRKRTENKWEKYGLRRDNLGL